MKIKKTVTYAGFHLKPSHLARSEPVPPTKVHSLQDQNLNSLEAAFSRSFVCLLWPSFETALSFDHATRGVTNKVARFILLVEGPRGPSLNYK